VRIRALRKHVAVELVVDPVGQLLSRAGDIPVLLTVPHGGWEKIPGIVAERVEPPSITGDSRYNKSSVDTNTQVIAGYVMLSLMKRGFTPYVVMTKVQRRTLDFNRSWSHNIQSHIANPFYRLPLGPSLAKASPTLKYRYDTFFDQIGVFQNQIKANFKSKLTKAIHIDFHGTSLPNNGDFAMGTLNGIAASARHFTSTANSDSFENCLIASGLRSASIKRNGKERLSGTHILKEFGRSSGGFNSIQLELGQTCRAIDKTIKSRPSDIVCQRTATKIADAILDWLRKNNVI